MHERLTSDAEILVHFALRPLVFEIYKVARKSEMQRITQTELEHLAVKSTFFTQNTSPTGPLFINFTLRPATFKLQCHQNKSELQQITPTEFDSQTYSITLNI